MDPNRSPISPDTGRMSRPVSTNSEAENLAEIASTSRDRRRASTTDVDLLIPDGWSPKDLQANRRRWLSPRQIGLLRKRMWKYELGSVFLIMPLIVFFIVAAMTEQRKSGYFIVLAGVAVILMALLIIVDVRVRNVQADLTAGRVIKAEGPIVDLFALRPIGQARASIGLVVLQYYGAPWDRGWRKDLRYLKWLRRTGMPVRAYYLPRSCLLVAAEPTIDERRSPPPVIRVLTSGDRKDLGGEATAL